MQGAREASGVGGERKIAALCMSRAKCLVGAVCVKLRVHKQCYACTRVQYVMRIRVVHVHVHIVRERGCVVYVQIKT